MFSRISLPQNNRGLSKVLTPPIEIEQDNDLRRHTTL